MNGQNEKFNYTKEQPELMNQCYNVIWSKRFDACQKNTIILKVNVWRNSKLTQEVTVLCAFAHKTE